MRSRRTEAEGREHEGLQDLLVRYAEDVAKQDGGGLSGEAFVEREKQGADTEAEGEHHADGHFAAVEAVARATHHRAGERGDDEHAFQRAEGEKGRASGPGEADVGEGVGGKADLPEHDKIPDDRAEDSGQRPGHEGVAHEVVGEVARDLLNHDGRIR